MGLKGKEHLLISADQPELAARHGGFTSSNCQLPGSIPTRQRCVIIFPRSAWQEIWAFLRSRPPHSVKVVILKTSTFSNATYLVWIKKTPWRYRSFLSNKQYPDFLTGWTRGRIQ